MINLARFEAIDAPPKGERDANCAACGRALCDHPDLIYGGVVPSSNHIRGQVASQLTK
jgi:hypothetical protein